MPSIFRLRSLQQQQQQQQQQWPGDATSAFKWTCTPSYDCKQCTSTNKSKHTVMHPTAIHKTKDGGHKVSKHIKPLGLGV
jgi:type II secretory pathway pseudopilin PulG